MKRYQQQINLFEIGLKGQHAIGNAAVLVIGAGGLGSVVAAYLTAMGIGKIGIVDFDTIEEHNLHRQFFYTSNDIGLNKAEVLKNRLSAQNPHIKIEAFNQRFELQNQSEIGNDYQIICDCTDHLPTRILIDKFSELNNRPLVHGAVTGWQGYVTVFNYKKKYGYSDMFYDFENLETQGCAVHGINSAVCGVIGSYMCNEVIKIVLNLETVLEGKLLTVNTLNNQTRLLKLKKHEKTI